METITLEINKRTKEGKTLLDMIEFYLANSTGVKIKTRHEAKIINHPISKKVPNAETLHIFKKNEKENGNVCESAADMYKKLGI